MTTPQPEPVTDPLPTEVVRAAGDSIIRSVGDDPAEYSAAERFEADQVAQLALIAALPALEPVRAAERQESARRALLDFAARRHEMAQVWGHDALWLTTGTKVAALVAEWAKEEAERYSATSDEEEA